MNVTKVAADWRKNRSPSFEGFMKRKTSPTIPIENRALLPKPSPDFFF
jgi:hypothetical protein